MRPIVLKVGPLAAANAAVIAASQTPAGAGALTLAGSPVVLDAPRRVIITLAANDSGRIFAIFGTNWSGAPIGETLAGGNAAAVQSALDYATITGVTINGAAAGAVTVGTNGVASSPWFRMDDYGTSSISMQMTTNGTVNGTLQYTLDDCNSTAFPVAPAAMNWINSTDQTAVGFTSTVQTSISQNQAFLRVLLNSGTGSITTTLVQGGTPPA